jgi:hypothetical protein
MISNLVWTSESPLEPKCFQTFFIKFKWGLFGKQPAQGPGDLAKILDESIVEPYMAQEGTNFLHSTWGWKVRDQIYLRFVNLNTPLRYDMPQYNPLLNHKMAFLPVKHKVLLFVPHQNQSETVQTILKR